LILALGIFQWHQLGCPALDIGGHWKTPTDTVHLVGHPAPCKGSSNK
jgi:hypothetical protein